MASPIAGAAAALRTEETGEYLGGLASSRELDARSRRRQRDRTVGEAAQVGKDIGALVRRRDAGESHDRAGNGALRVVDELVELLEIPIAAFALEGGRVVEGLHVRLRAADDAVKVRADLVRPALLEGVAGLALLCRGLALCRIGLGEEDRQRLRRCGGLLRRRALGYGFGEGIAGLARFLRREQGARDDVEAHDEEQHAEKRAGDLVDLEGIHHESSILRDGGRVRGRGPAALLSRIAPALATTPFVAARERDDNARSPC